MTEQLSPHELALRKLPLPYSLALRLRDAGVAPEVVCEYVGVDEAALPGIYRLAEQKLADLQAAFGEHSATSGAAPRCTRQPPDLTRSPLG